MSSSSGEEKLTGEKTGGRTPSKKGNVVHLSFQLFCMQYAHTRAEK